jgi:hypothetical protein
MSKQQWKKAEEEWKEVGEIWESIPDKMVVSALMGGCIGAVIGFALVIVMYITRWHP